MDTSIYGAVAHGGVHRQRWKNEASYGRREEKRANTWERRKGIRSLRKEEKGELHNIYASREEKGVKFSLATCWKIGIFQEQ
jgi:hypothetical protein